MMCKFHCTIGIKYGNSSEIHFHRKLCLCEYIPRWKLNGLNVSIIFDAGRMIVYVVISDVRAIFYIIFVLFSVFWVFFSHLRLLLLKCGRCESWKLEKSILMKFPLLLLIPDPFIFLQWMLCSIFFVF